MTPLIFFLLCGSSPLIIIINLPTSELPINDAEMLYFVQIITICVNKCNTILHQALQLPGKFSGTYFSVLYLFLTLLVTSATFLADYKNISGHPLNWCKTNSTFWFLYSLKIKCSQFFLKFFNVFSWKYLRTCRIFSFFYQRRKKAWNLLANNLLSRRKML